MQEKHVELFIPGELKEEPIICNMIRNYKVDIKIVEASFSTESGWAYLIIHGEEEEIARMFDYLGDKGISIEEQ
ncbi:MAG: NIL domain-containing protein [Candidatus Omnitrophica bacterium]|nr:NIL domain-containing protein [Candidatus Omnitrophota bacterium]MDD5487957.1 NIL domain-containing protein [Candidatus Omnitrophota bacterium]